MPQPSRRPSPWASPSGRWRAIGTLVPKMLPVPRRRPRTLPALRRPRDVRSLLVYQAAAFVLVIDLGVVGLLFPSVVPSVPWVTTSSGRRRA